MFTPTLRCECAQPGLIDTMRKWSIHTFQLDTRGHMLRLVETQFFPPWSNYSVRQQQQLMILVTVRLVLVG